MAQRGISRPNRVVVSLKTCDVCGRVLPRGCAARHPSCEASDRRMNESFLSVRLAEQPFFEEVIRQAQRPFLRDKVLCELDAARLLRRYDSAPSATDMADFLTKLMKNDVFAPCMSGLSVLLHRFLRLAPDCLAPGQK